ncbi:Sucrase/ferredoxin-like-domain-containing protein [Dichomitus squalens]|nr:Sucrase/ferredoxin-like-domain-containing protein [Dichomitus squalens]
MLPPSLSRPRLPAACNNVSASASRLIRDLAPHYPRSAPAAPASPSVANNTALRLASNIPAAARGPHVHHARGFRSTAPRHAGGLAGTAPAHTAYVLLHTHAPPAAYPPKSASPLWRELALRARRWGGAVNFAWAPGQAVHPAYAGLGEAGDEGEEEAYVASVFSPALPAGRLVVPEVTRANLDAVDGRLRALVRGDPGEGGGEGEAWTAGEAARDEERLCLYVCTHGARDCRCGDSGGDVARALRREVASRQGLAERVSVGEVAHVGGHKYAANVLVYPYGEWLGTVQECDVPRLLDELLAWHAAHRHVASPHDRPPLCPPFWRGRMGLDKEEQIALHARRGSGQ